MLDDFPSLRAQRDAFRDAAAREIAASVAPRRRRRLRRVAAVAAAAALGAGGVAAATDLISIGEPQRDTVDRPANRLPSTGYDVVVTAADTPLPWGVGLFSAANGESCVIAGQLRGTRLGVIQDGTFRPFASDTGGACRRSGDRDSVLDQRTIGDRFVVFGLASDRARSVELVERTGDRRTARTGRGGAFLFVYDRGTRVDAIADVIPRDAAGRRLP